MASAKSLHEPHFLVSHYLRGYDVLAEPQKIILIIEPLLQAEKLIESCEGCNPIGAEIPFDWTLKSYYRLRLVRHRLRLLPAKCPNC